MVIRLQRSPNGSARTVDLESQSITDPTVIVARAASSRTNCQLRWDKPSQNLSLRVIDPKMQSSIHERQEIICERLTGPTLPLLPLCQQQGGRTGEVMCAVTI